MVRKMKSAAAATPQRLIYVGPTLKGYKLIQYQVFIGGYPTHIDNVFAECPQIKHLFVPVSELNTAESDIAKAGTPLHKYYALAAKWGVK